MHFISRHFSSNLLSSILLTCFRNYYKVSCYWLNLFYRRIAHSSLAFIPLINYRICYDLASLGCTMEVIDDIYEDSLSLRKLAIS